MPQRATPMIHISHRWEPVRCPQRPMGMTKLIASLLALCLIAAACGDTPTPGSAPDSDTPTTVAGPDPDQPAADPGAPTTASGTDQPAASPDNSTTVPAPETVQPATEPGTPTAVLEPVADRLPADPDAPVDAWVAGINAAGWGFHRHLEGNAVSSPMSIGIAFSMSRAGASADSAAVLDAIFGYPETGVHEAANAVDLALAGVSVDTTTLEVANRLFPDDGFTMRPEFLEVASTHYGAGIEPVDTADGDAAADAVNRWVAQSTRGLVPVIVDGGTVQDQRLVLVNTVYLQAAWAQPFLAGYTHGGYFATGDRTVTVPFMTDSEPLWRRYVRLDGADAVELPYLDGGLAMWIVVPRDRDGLAAVEEALDAAALTSLASAAQAGYVDLTMPKWEQTLPPTDLFEWLCPLRFCAGAGFDGIAPGIFITAALHGAKVIVDEKGTEAAAATAMAFQESAPPLPDITVVADRPFLWAIVHQPTGAVLFLGRVVDPAENRDSAEATEPGAPAQAPDAPTVSYPVDTARPGNSAASDAPQPGPEPPTGTHSQLGPLGRLHWAQQLTVPLVYADAAFDAPALTAAADGGRILFEIADGNTRDRTVVELEGVGLWEAVTPDPEDYIDAFLVPAPALSTVRWRAASAAAPDAGDGRYRIGAWTDWSVLQVPQPEPPSAGVDRAEAP